MRWSEITEIEQMDGDDWNTEPDDRMARVDRYVDDAEPYTQIGGYTVKRTIDRKITCLMFYDGEKLFGFAILGEENVRPNAVDIEIAFDKAYQRKGLGLATYKFLINQGYTIVSGSNQYPGAVAIWKKLMKDPSVVVRTLTPNDINSRNPTYKIKPVKGPDHPWTTSDDFLRLMAYKA